MTRLGMTRLLPGYPAQEGTCITRLKAALTERPAPLEVVGFGPQGLSLFVSL